MTEAGDSRTPDAPCAWCGREKALGFATISPSASEETRRYCHGDQERPTCYEMASRAMFAANGNPIFPSLGGGLVELKRSMDRMEKSVQKVAEQLLLIGVRLEELDLK